MNNLDRARLDLAEVNKHETDFVYDEVFLQDSYLKHVDLPQSPTVLDVGANIGLFSKLVLTKRPSAQVVAIEPGKRAFSCLSQNLGKTRDRAICLNIAVAASNGSSLFRDYRNYSTISGIRTNLHKDTATILEGARSVIPHTSYDDILEQMSEYEEYTVPTKTISTVISQHIEGSVDLLKIDAEGVEAEIFASIDHSVVSLIDHIVLESHSVDELPQLVDTLKSLGYEVIVEPDKNLAQSGIHIVWGTRK